MRIEIIGDSLWFFDVGSSSIYKDNVGETYVRVDMSREERIQLRDKINEKEGA